MTSGSNLPPNEPKKPEERSTFKDKFDSLRKHEKVEGLYQFARTNTKDTIAYIIAIIGIILLFFQPFFGCLLIGIVGGLYFSPEINFLLKHSNEFIEDQGMVRSVILGIILIAFFIAAPGIFIGAALALALKLLFGTQDVPK